MNKGIFPFIPRRAFFENSALEYPLGKQLLKVLQEMGVEIKLVGSHNRITGIPGKTPREAYQEGKSTMVVGVRKTLEFQTCKPSAHFQLPLATSCPGMCQYCYLNTTLGRKPYIRVYVNVAEILDKAKEYIDSRIFDVTVFEGAATSDPLPVEPYTGALAKAIEFFGTQEMGRFRFVTKFTNVDSLLKLEHREHTRFRFSINTPAVIEQYEQRTPRLLQRLEAAQKVYQAGYPAGFIVAPVIEYEGWQEEYFALFSELEKRFGSGDRLTIELITHRFTQRAKENILNVFPETTLPMGEANRKFKYGQFGYGKYIYSPEKMEEIKTSLHDMIEKNIPQAKVEYFI
ncbi:spore photoproduct lyase [Phosphitispora sp. TUW77]